MKKQTKQSKSNKQKQTANEVLNYDKMNVVFYFDRLDRDGHFAFNVLRDKFNYKEVLTKIVEYSNLTWSEIKLQTHDKSNKSKHHFLEYSGLSKLARDRISKLDMESEIDAIFSFALQNKLRLIGIRENEKFHVVWYDPEHEFCPSGK